MKKIICCFVLLYGAWEQLWANNEKNAVSAPLQSATIYRNAAELVHTARLSLSQGSNELMIDGLSNSIDINSLRIGCNASITIMSVEFSTNYLKPLLPGALVKKLQDSLELEQRELNGIQNVLKTDNELLELLRSNREVKGSQAGLSVSELVKLADYYRSKTFELQREISLYKEKEQKQGDIIAKLKNQIGEEERKNAKTMGRLLLRIMSPVSGNYQFTITYLTTRASWQPCYDLRVDDIAKPVRLSYKARIVQTTGFDWKGVKLSLATALPSQQGNAPVLKSWFLGYVDPVRRLNRTLDQSSLAAPLAGRAAGLQEVVVMGYSNKVAADDEKEPAAPLYVLNGTVISEEEFKKINPGVIKAIQRLKGAEATAMYGARAAGGAVVATLKEGVGDYVTVNDTELNVTYDIDLPYDVPGNGKEQNLVLKDVDVPASYKYYAVPKLDRNAYLLGEMPHWEQLNLLPGDANIIFEGTYVGKSFIDPNSIQDTLNLTLGNDKRIVVKREKLADFSSVKFLSSAKRQVFTYQLTVKNNKKEKVQMVLKDQYPISTSKDIEVELLESKDAEVNSDTGVVTWKLELAPGEQKIFRFGYSVKYAKDKILNLN